MSLASAAQVAKASFSGMRVLHRLRGSYAIWPFDPPGPRTVVEIEKAIAVRAAESHRNVSSAPPRWDLVDILLEGVRRHADGDGYGGDVEVAGVGIEGDDFHANGSGPGGGGPDGGPALKNRRG